ncbi:hypothetical protein EYF80_028430 [Liparis tanakae]|uniref:Uncharacterized protein n=1 Tax=Liparis tanakae TaxID=230148 RepID=A0A4Z2H8R1_9TELE|nr:hypothetical protein EYF80_028430 [Liparis tanakae]
MAIRRYKGVPSDPRYSHLYGGPSGRRRTCNPAFCREPHAEHRAGLVLWWGVALDPRSRWIEESHLCLALHGSRKSGIRVRTVSVATVNVSRAVTNSRVNM